MKTLIILVGLIIFFSISISSSYAGDVQLPETAFPTDTPILSDSAMISVENAFDGNTADTPALNDMATAVLNPPACDTPGSGDWTITQDCVLISDFSAPANVRVQNGALLMIPNGVILDINFLSRNITIEFGSGVLIKAGGSIITPPIALPLN